MGVDIYDVNGRNHMHASKDAAAECEHAGLAQPSVCVCTCDTVCVCAHLSTVNNVRPRAKNYVHLCPRGDSVSGWRWEAQGGSTAQVASSDQAESRGLGTRVPYRPGSELLEEGGLEEATVWSCPLGWGLLSRPLLPGVAESTGI